MEATLVVVTLVSLASAVGLAIVTWRLLQEERHRADARVALLEEGLADSIAANPLLAPASPSTAAPDLASVPAFTFTALAADDPTDASEQDLFAADRLFATHATDATPSAAPTRSRGVIALGGAMVVVALILAVWSVGRLLAPGADQPAAAAPVAVDAPPLELVSLQQTREGDALTINGVVRNPPSGATSDRLAAVVAFFDGNGQQLASVRAPLDFRSLAPGDESPFQVTTTVPPGVIRYRVSFRRDEGTIVPHVDRRQQETR